MHRPSLPQLFILFARTAVRRFRNRFAYVRQKRREAKAKKLGLPPPREATAHRNQKFRAGNILGWLFMAYMTFVFAMMAYSSLDRANRGLLDMLQPDAETQHAAKPDGANYRSMTEKEREMWTQKAARRAQPLEHMSATTRGVTDRASALLMAMAGAGAFLFAIGAASRQLARPEPSLAWLFEFPVSRGVLFTSRLCEGLFDSSLLLLAMMPGAYLSLRGYGFLPSVGWGVAFGFLIALAVSALHIATEVTLLQKCPRRRRGTIGGLCAACGTLLMVAVLYGGGTPVLLRGLIAVGDAMPGWAWWNPLSAGFAAGASSPGMQWLVVAGITGVLCGVSVLYCSRLTRYGLEPGLETARGAAPRSAPVQTGRAARPIGLVGKELLMLVRQRSVLVQVLLAPLVIVAMMYFQTSGGLAERTFGSANALSSAIYGICAYMVLIASQVAMNTELRTLWLLLSLPRPLSDSLRVKSLIWGGAAAALALVLCVGASIARTDLAGDLLWRLPFILILVALIADLSVGIRTAGSSIISETTVHFRQWANWLPLLLSAAAGQAVFAGDVWMLCVQTVLLGALDISVWQKLRAEMPYLTEPAEDPPPRLYLMHGLLSAYGYFVLQSLGMLIATAVRLPAGAILPAASALAAGVVALLAWWQLSRRKVEIIPPDGASWQRCGAIALLACAAACVLGWAWLQLIAWMPWTAEKLAELRAVSAGSMSGGMLIGLAVLAVIVAPVAEEFIFRGLTFHGLRRSHGFLWSMLWTSLFFTAVHPPLSSGAVFALAAVNAWVMERTRRLWPCILVHAGYNAFMLWLQMS